jgi:hypothetical protein
MNLCCAPRGAVKLAFVVILVTIGDSAPALAQSTLAACVDRVVNAARLQGAKPGSARAVDFLLTGDERSYDYALPETGCLGFVAVGHRQVLHLGLSLFAPSGATLARDRGRDAHAYARVCGDAGQRVVVNVRMLDGEGEFHLVPLWDAPSELDALESIMATCMSTGTARPDLVDVGPEPSGPPLELGLLSVARKLLPLGYELQPELLAGGLLERRRDLRQVSLRGGRCYALAAVGDGDVEDIDLRLLSLSGSGALVASDVTRSREAIVKVCPEQGADAEYALDVRMYRGGGNYVVQSFALNEALGPLPPGVDGNTRIAYTELIAQLGERGMRSIPVAWGLVQPERTQSVPVQLRAGHCYAVGAVASGDVGAGDLDMSLIDERGRFLAAEIGPNPNPLVYHCAERDLTARAVVQSHQIPQPARFLVLLGEQATETHP